MADESKRAGDEMPASGPSLLSRFLDDRAQARLMAPLLREFDERRMRQLVSECWDEIEGRDRVWLEGLGARTEASDTGFAIVLGDRVCQIEPGPGAAILIDGMPIVPEQQFFTRETYRRVRAHIEGWARPARRR